MPIQDEWLPKKGFIAGITQRRIDNCCSPITRRAQADDLLVHQQPERSRA